MLPAGGQLVLIIESRLDDAHHIFTELLLHTHMHASPHADF